MNRAMLDESDKQHIGCERLPNHIIDGTIFIINVQYGPILSLLKAEPLTFRAF
jgi:hypothetical protein